MNKNEKEIVEMYAKLSLELENNEIGYFQSSNLQGVMMEAIDSEYAELLHRNQLNPYSQFVTKEDGKTIWHIHTVSEEAYEKILLPVAKLSSVYIRQKDKEIKIGKRELNTCLEKELLDEFYGEKCEKYLNVSFLTPTSFKRDGKYVNYPDLRLIYGSLMRKYSAASETMDMVDEDTLEELVEKSEIVRYRLQTSPFPMEKIRVTGFVGNICIHANGTETLARYIRMLLRFGEYSGIGIKTGVGMGAIRYNRRQKDE